MKKILRVVVLVLALAIAAFGAFLYMDRVGHPEQPGEISGKAAPQEWVDRLGADQRQAAADLAAAAKLAAPTKQVLFGDLHVHTTYSTDAFVWAMPVFHGEGVHPPAEACDYARFCSSLDFWATTEHAESLTPRHWRDLKETVRKCNAVAGDPQNPDLVTFLGWEWTQMGDTPEDHYGHKNVILLDTADDKVPTRPISAGGIAASGMKGQGRPYYQDLIGPYMDWGSRQSQFDQQYKIQELRAQKLCDAGVPVRDLPEDCLEYTATPHELFAKLDDWGFDALVIPHGNTWGYYTPPGASWDKQLSRQQHDPKRQTLIEVFSGHGNSEEFRKWREVAYDAQGNAVCPEPTNNYLPSCWRAGELIRERCGDAAPEVCDERVKRAQLDYLRAGRAGHLVVGGVQPEDWLDSGQCRDCFMPAFNYRPGVSTQYAMALSNFEEKAEDGDGPLRFRFGFIASSDNHAAEPGTGFKQVGRHANTEVGGQEGIIRQSFIDEAKPKGARPESVPFDLNQGRYNFLQIAETERQQSFFYTGGLVAVHSAGRSRQQIWDALKQREVYGTSGERLLLWFDLLGANGTVAPMGSSVELAGAPRFRVRAIGDFEQKPGCPEHSVSALGAEQVDSICRGECYHPSDTRKPIDRIEVIRILPQAQPGEPVEDLIQDPWQTFACSGDAAGCLVEFSDPDPVARTREAIYYVRAVGKAVPTVNAGNLRCERDEKGACVKAKPCHGDLRTPLDDDCMAPAAHRAWSSPIFVQPRKQL
jgi:hypothetical protein